MQRIKKGKQGLAFILGLMLGRIVRGGLFGVCRARRCHATAVLSNPGRVFASGPLRSDTGQVTLGSLVLETLDFLTPVRPKTNVAFATFSYAGRLHVTLHYDPLTIGVSLAQTLLDEFMRELRNPSGNAPPQTLGT
jgi:hypothetical protein